MTGNNLFIDTNIVIDIFKGNNIFSEKISKSNNVYLSMISLGELQIGVHRVINKSKHLKQLNYFLSECILISVDETTAQNYGKISAQLFKKGTPIPTNDIWIAATALQHNFTLITKDKHFNKIEKLKVQFW